MSDPAIPAIADPTLLAELRRYGRFDGNACYQCGSCTIACDLVTEHVRMPRLVLRYGLLGLRRPLLASVMPWICHDCGDCSILCPREADPRLSMMTARRFLAARYDWTGMTSRILRSRAWYVASLVAAALLVAALIVVYHLVYRGLVFRDIVAMPMGLEHMFPTMRWFAVAVVVLPLLLMVSQAARMWWFTMARAGGRVPFSAYVAQARTYAVHSVAQPLMRRCMERARWKWHWMLGAGLVIKLAILVFALRWFQTDTIHPITNPQRWLGYLITLFLLLGAGGILACHARGVKEVCKSSELGDVMLPILLVLTAISGLVAHVLRISGLALACHYAYALHVVIAAPLLLVEIPFGKGSHMIYRPLALYFQAVRERAAGPAAPAAAEAGHAA